MTYNLVENYYGGGGGGECDFTATAGGTNYYFGGKLIKNPSGYVYPDRLGSVGKFYPYGIERPSATTNGKEKFTGYFRDADTGNDYAINRYMTPGMGRFITPDRTMGGATPSDPQSWNKYAYTEGDPTNRVDHDGTSFQDCVVDDSCDDYVFTDPLLALTVQAASYDPSSPCYGQAFSDGPGPGYECLAVLGLVPAAYQAPSCTILVASSGTPLNGQNLVGLSTYSPTSNVLGRTTRSGDRRRRRVGFLRYRFRPAFWAIQIPPTGAGHKRSPLLGTFRSGCLIEPSRRTYGPLTLPGTIVQIPEQWQPG